MPPIRARSQRKRADWNGLHSSLRNVYLRLEQTRMVAVLDNFRDKKEAICRKLGVVCNSDVARIASELKAKIAPQT